MNVSELIARLKLCDPTAQVLLSSDPEGNGFGYADPRFSTVTAENKPGIVIWNAYNVDECDIDFGEDDE